ncbi:hypothetical protein ACQP1V_27340 [Microtetraspora malaysiensis]|uniref:hypothetical protein n=1 Tax=Microtetraspora malaysiensis TaxID=161358 RepID=UPI003D8D80D7
MRASPDGPVRFQLVGDSDDRPGLFDSVMFVTTSKRIPPNWVVTVDGSGIVELAPSRWLSIGFWDGYFDDLPVEVEIFEEERRIIEESS